MSCVPLECKPFGAFSFVCRMLRHGGVSDETFGSLSVVVELDGEEGDLASPPAFGADIASPHENGGYLPSSGSCEQLVPDPPGLTEEIPGELGGDGGSEGVRTMAGSCGAIGLIMMRAACGACVRSNSSSKDSE